MNFTAGQWAIIVLFTELFIWDLLTKLLNTIKFCANAKAFIKYLKNVENVENLEEKKDEESK